ncbi:predicted protein [Chaetoceros tenuissimus]|uniref:Uncharacterized protein n=1 Tax=Chaetoceros tenuissimus TaxID=426638 RepID=A0AAD3GZ42_9STRA|nr:predicted protein [Chaetoceros tenuissimus]
MALTSRSRRSNGIPTTTNITNTPKENGTFTRTTVVIYSNGTEITMKETLTALEIEQLEDPSYSTCTSHSILTPELTSISNARNETASPMRLTSSSSFAVFISRKDDSPAWYHLSTLLVLFSFVCAMMIATTTKNTRYKHQHEYEYHENSFASFLSFFCSFVAIPIMFNLGSAYQSKEKNDSTTSQESNSAGDVTEYVNTWFLLSINVYSCICFLFCIFHLGIVLVFPESGLEFTITGTLWNIMTFFVMVGRTEYLRRKQKNDELYQLFHSFNTSYGISTFFFVISMMSGYTCAISFVMIEEIWFIENIVMAVIYILFSKVAYLLMWCGSPRTPNYKIGYNDAEEAIIPLVPQGESVVQPSSFGRCCSRIRMLSIVMYIMSITLDLILIDWDEVNGLGIFLRVSWNAIPWLLIETTGKLFKGQSTLKYFFQTRLEHTQF